MNAENKFILIEAQPNELLWDFAKYRILNVCSNLIIHIHVNPTCQTTVDNVKMYVEDKI